MNTPFRRWLDIWRRKSGCMAKSGRSGSALGRPGTLIAAACIPGQRLAAQLRAPRSVGPKGIGVTVSFDPAVEGGVSCVWPESRRNPQAWKLSREFWIYSDL